MVTDLTPASLAVGIDPAASTLTSLQAAVTFGDGDNEPVELAISYFDPWHYSYRVKLRRG
jgi:hypothetical protein